MAHHNLGMARLQTLLLVWPLAAAAVTCAATLQPTCSVCPWQQHTPHSHNTMVTRLTIPCYSHVPAYVVRHALPPTQPPAANMSLAGWQAAGPCSVSQPRQHAAGWRPARCQLWLSAACASIW
jgi:hypothetical protein